MFGKKNRRVKYLSEKLTKSAVSFLRHTEMLENQIEIAESAIERKDRLIRNLKGEVEHYKKECEIRVSQVANGYSPCFNDLIEPSWCYTCSETDCIFHPENNLQY